MISYQTQGVKAPKLAKRKINAWIKEVAKIYDRTIGEIAYIFTDDPGILEVNKQYLEHNYFTDVITFDYCENKVLHGDIFISLDTIKSNAQDYGVSYETELYRVLIHGILHLTGQDDKTPETQEVMTQKENNSLELLHSYIEF